MRFGAVLAAFAFLVGMNGSAQAYPASEDVVIEAERRFSAAAGEVGVVAAFKANIAPDGILFRPDPINGAEWLNAQAERPPQPGGLTWWPVFAGISRSGDLGFTTGPWKARDVGGYYLTIWRRQPDGSWRFAIDHGPVLTPSPLGKDTPVDRLPRFEGPAVQDRLKTIAEVFAVEDRLIAAAANDLPRAFAGVLAADARIMGGAGPGQPAVGKDAWTEELRRRPSRAAFRRVGGDVSEAGDLAYTYGHASWSGSDGAEVKAHFVRVWQRRPSGWVLVLDELV